MHILLDEGNNLRALPLPGGGWFDAGDDKTAAELRAMVNLRYRKQTKGEKTRGCSHTHPQRVRELDGGNGWLQLPESTKMLAGVGDENDDGELDAGSLNSFLLAETTSTARRSERDQPQLEASSTVAAISDHGGARVSAGVK